MQKSKVNRGNGAGPTLGVGCAKLEATSGRPTREVFRQLRLLPGSVLREIDADSADAAVLTSLAANAETSMRAIHLGLGALGHLVARCSVDIEDGTVSAECMANLGFLMAELGDLAAECLAVASQCRAATRTKLAENAYAHSE